MKSHQRLACLVLFAGLSGCGGQGADSTTPEAEKANASKSRVEQDAPKFRRAHVDWRHKGEAAECDDPFPENPEWALKPGAPLPSAGNLSGMWIPIEFDSTATGILSSKLECYGGIAVMTIQQDGLAVETSWVFMSPASGAVALGYGNSYEFATGQLQGHNLVLSGKHLETYHHFDSQTATRECTKTNYELRWDEHSQHLVGTRNGQPIRFAPFEVLERTTDCGPAPA